MYLCHIRREARDLCIQIEDESSFILASDKRLCLCSRNLRILVLQACEALNIYVCVREIESERDRTSERARETNSVFYYIHTGMYVCIRTRV